MATKLTHEIHREILIGGEPFTVIISPDGVRLSRKRFRSGHHLSWDELWQVGSSDVDVPATGSAPVPGGSRGV